MDTSALLIKDLCNQVNRQHIDYDNVLGKQQQQRRRRDKGGCGNKPKLFHIRYKPPTICELICTFFSSQICICPIFFPTKFLFARLIREQNRKQRLHTNLVQNTRSNMNSNLFIDNTRMPIACIKIKERKKCEWNAVVANWWWIESNETGPAWMHDESAIKRIIDWICRNIYIALVVGCNTFPCVAEKCIGYLWMSVDYCDLMIFHISHFISILLRRTFASHLFLCQI